VTVQITAQGRSSGVKLEGQGANVFTFKDGKIVRFKLFPDERRSAGGRDG